MITNYQTNNIMNLLFGKSEYVVPDTLYLGLSMTTINEDGTGVTEPVGNAYARVAIPNNKESFSNADNGVITNLIQIIYEESTGAWGTITHAFISDAATDGNVLYYDALAKERIVQESSSLTFPVGALTFTLKNATE